MVDAIEAADFAKKGTWPVHVGYIDQPAVLLSACRLIWAEDAAHRAELKLQTDE